MSRRVVHPERAYPGSWVADAECKHSYGTHFPTAASNTMEFHAQVARAKAMCDVCPVKTPCIEYAVANREQDGIWGGYLFPNGIRAYKRRLASQRKAS